MRPTKLPRGQLKTSLLTVILHLLLLAIVILLAMPFNVFEYIGITGKATEAPTLATVSIKGSFPPTFDHNISNFTINQTDTFYFDVNCSDADPIDSITYSDNFTGFEINDTSGVINQSGFNESFVGNNTIAITCTDNFLNFSTTTFRLEILNVQGEPILSPIGNQLAIEGVAFTLQLEAIDFENDILTFGENITFIEINETSGFLNFTPTLAQVGNHTINFTVFDGTLYDYEVILLTIVRGPFCGDAACSLEESCEICELDCGVCPEAPSSSGGAPSSSSSSGGRGVASTAVGSTSQQAQQQPDPRCDERWECSVWSVCSLESIQDRTCKDVNGCGTTEDKPDERQECEYVPTCFDNIRNGGEIGVDCGGPCEPCFVATCFDGIQNQGEEGIDCGGPCIACKDKVDAVLPTLEIPGLIDLPRKFPWLFPLIIFIILLLILLGDYFYRRHLLKNKLNVYKQKMIAYTPWRRRLYKMILNLLAISFVTTLYMYYYSNDFEAMKKNIWILLTIILFIPTIISLIIRRYRYSEYEKERKEHRFKQTHREGLLTFIRIENTYLHDLEAFTKRELFRHTKNHEYDSYPTLYSIFSGVYGMITDIVKKRKDRLGQLRIQKDALNAINIVLADETLASYVKYYPEFDSIQQLLVHLTKHVQEDNTDTEQRLLDEIEELTKPHLKTVITSDDKLITLYNHLVDVYNVFSKRKDTLVELDTSLFSLERRFNDQVKALTKKSKEIQKISHDHTLAATYNNFMRLFNHYSKKQQLRKALDKL